LQSSANHETGDSADTNEYQKGLPNFFQLVLLFQEIKYAGKNRLTQQVFIGYLFCLGPCIYYQSLPLIVKFSVGKICQSKKYICKDQLK
jgi:hypothetical protein